MISVKRFDGISPWIGYTDFISVYISNILNDEEFNIVYKHEASHIWLQHLNRSKSLRAKESDKFDFKRWNQAADLEIALHIYNDQDETTINLPRSYLNGVICKKHLSNYADCVYAEDFYYKLFDKPLGNNSHDGESNKELSLDQDKDQKNNLEELSKEQKESLIKKAVEEIKSQLSEIKRQSELQKFSESTIKFRPRPSLAGEIDSILGRGALKRVDSYRRPNRRESSVFFKKGRINEQKIAKAIIYLDRSGSFSPCKTKEADSTLIKILAKYRTKIERDVVYFHDELFIEEPNSSGGTNYLAVANDIVKQNPELAIIITDDDYCDTECANVVKNISSKILIVPIGCSQTQASKYFNAKEFSI